MDMNVVLKVFLIYLLSAVQTAVSVEVPGLYEAEVISNSQSSKDRNAAIKKALEIVLGKVMAGEQITLDGAVQIALEDAAHYVTQYQYSLIPSEADNNSSARLMRVIFDESALLELMQSSKLGIWSEVRDETLVWLVVDDAGKRQFFSENEMPDLANALTKAARQKGLPLLFPLLDLEEQQRISVNDVLSAYSERLLEASKRYAVVSVLSGRIQKKGQCWDGEWAFYFNQQIKQWGQTCKPLDEVMLGGLQGAYDQLSRYFAVKPDTLEIDTVILKVLGIQGMTDMTTVTEYLVALPMIESVSWLRVESGANLYKVKYAGSRKAFEELLGLGRVLEPQKANAPGGEELEYRLLKDKI